MRAKVVIPLCITHRPLPTCQVSFKSKKLFVYGWMDIETLRPALLGNKDTDAVCSLPRCHMTVLLLAHHDH